MESQSNKDLVLESIYSEASDIVFIEARRLSTEEGVDVLQLTEGGDFTEKLT